jgi:hypothetical protein
MKLNEPDNAWKDAADKGGFDFVPPGGGPRPPQKPVKPAPPASLLAFAAFFSKAPIGWLLGLALFLLYLHAGSLDGMETEIKDLFWVVGAIIRFTVALTASCFGAFFHGLFGR